MKLKAVITDSAPEALVEAFGGKDFALRFLTLIVGAHLDVLDPINRPAEYYVQEPDRTVCVGNKIGVELRFTGVSRNGRKAERFHKALAALVEIAKETIQSALGHDAQEVQLFCVLMLDGDVETSPGSGKYSSVLESEPLWVRREPS